MPTLRPLDGVFKFMVSVDPSGEYVFISVLRTSPLSSEKLMVPIMVTTLFTEKDLGLYCRSEIVG